MTSIQALYTLYTPSHEVFYQDWLLPSLKDHFEVRPTRLEARPGPHDFLSDGWGSTMLAKVELILSAIARHWGGVFVYSDVDIQFFRPVQEAVQELMEDNDILFQNDNPAGRKCAGFFVCKAGQETSLLWQRVRAHMIEHRLNSDQAALNEVASGCAIRWAYLPATFFGGGALTGKAWAPTDVLPVPNDIVMHHANWTTGIANKIAQLCYVRDVVARRAKDPR